MTVFKENKLPIIYPSSDGKPMADNTVQFNWLVKIKQGLEKTTKNKEIFVAGDLLWYPVEGDNKTRLVPDILVAVGRPKGDRGSYLQWREANIPPQLVIEILSPGNRKKEMSKKQAFYERYGVEEYLIFDPKRHKLTIYERVDKQLRELPVTTKYWKSSFIDFSLRLTAETLELYHPDGSLFKSHLELDDENEAIRAEREREKQEKLVFAQKLRELGINPDDLLKR